MKYCILMGSSRKEGNTMALLEPVMETLTEQGQEHELIWLHDKKIHPCVACRSCQKDWSSFGCRYQDDGEKIFHSLMDCQMIILATPIYSWYCTPPMKAVLDRMVYGMNKYYGDEKGPALWKGKKLALLVTCGYPPQTGADLLEEGIKRYCKHSQSQYVGMIAERHMGYHTSFMDEDKGERARKFAMKLIDKNI